MFVFGYYLKFGFCFFVIFCQKCTELKSSDINTPPILIQERIPDKSVIYFKVQLETAY